WARCGLAAGEGRRMRSLAEAWQCDPSNTTWIVDRLEKLGLAERRAVAEDRRIKHVVLTAQGARTRAELMDEFHSPPPEVAGLARADLECLQRVLAKMAPADAPHAGSRRRRRR